LPVTPTARFFGITVTFIYNFIRSHKAIGNLTPAEAAGINLEMEEDKVQNLIRQTPLDNKI
jgi:hypothetical protein